MRELLREKALWISILITAAGMALGIPFYEMKLPLEAGSFLEFFKMGLSSKTVAFLVPITAVLPAGAAYIRELETGFIKLYISRVSRMKYIRSKTFLICAGGFLVFFLSGIFVLLCCFLFLYPLELKGEFQLEQLKEAVFLLLRLSLTASVLSGISGVFAGIFQNYYMAYGLPFVCYYMLIILKERYLPGIYSVYPPEWIRCEQDWGRDGVGLWIVLLVFLAGTALLHELILYFRIKEIS